MSKSFSGPEGREFHIPFPRPEGRGFYRNPAYAGSFHVRAHSPGQSARWQLFDARLCGSRFGHNAGLRFTAIR